MKSVTAQSIADYLIEYAREHGDFLTNLKLQKLLYYTQAWHLALYDKPLFEDDLEAWVHGPVVACVYRKFKRYKFNPITATIAKPHLPARVCELVQEVFEKYGRFTALDLERMSHEETPWKMARGDLSPESNSCAVISHNDMTDFFRKKLNG